VGADQSIDQFIMIQSKTKTVGAYEAKTHLGSLLDEVAKGREVIITKRERPVARLVPMEATPSSKEIFERFRALRGALKLGKNETLKDLINAGRRI
jgi:prevent-host-death family protein